MIARRIAARFVPALADATFDGIAVRTLVRWRVVGIVKRGFWRVVAFWVPICPSCHQRVDGVVRMSPWGRCWECDERLWDLARDAGGGW